MNEDQYYYLLDGKEHGPFSRAAIESLFRLGKLQGALVKSRPEQPWQMPEEIGIGQRTLSPQASHSSPHKEPVNLVFRQGHGIERKQKSKGLAVLTLIFLGLVSFGAHKSETIKSFLGSTTSKMKTSSTRSNANSQVEPPSQDLRSHLEETDKRDSTRSDSSEPDNPPPREIKAADGCNGVRERIERQIRPTGMMCTKEVGMQSAATTRHCEIALIGSRRAAMDLGLSVNSDDEMLAADGFADSAIYAASENLYRLSELCKSPLDYPEIRLPFNSVVVRDQQVPANLSEAQSSIVLANKFSQGKLEIQAYDPLTKIVSAAIWLMPPQLDTLNPRPVYAVEATFKYNEPLNNFVLPFAYQPRIVNGYSGSTFALWANETYKNSQIPSGVFSTMAENVEKWISNAKASSPVETSAVAIRVPIIGYPPKWNEYPQDSRYEAISSLIRDPNPSTISVTLDIDVRGTVVAAEISEAKFDHATPVGLNDGSQEWVLNYQSNVALKSVKTWKFKPATKDGIPVSSRARVPISFLIN
jgi:hypothetical protein